MLFMNLLASAVDVQTRGTAGQLRKRFGYPILYNSIPDGGLSPGEFCYSSDACYGPYIRGGGPPVEGKLYEFAKIPCSDNKCPLSYYQ